MLPLIYAATSPLTPYMMRACAACARAQRRLRREKMRSARVMPRVLLPLYFIAAAAERRRCCFA